MESILLFLPRLSSKLSIIITMHQKPDADAMGSSLGLKLFLEKMGHEVKVISPTNWPNFLNWMPDCSQVIDFESKGGNIQSEFEGVDVIFCLDFNQSKRVKGLEPFLIKSSAPKIMIDHHQEPQTAFFEFGISDTSKSSTAEMVYDLIIEAGKRELIDEKIATCLYAGVVTDTGSFRFPSTTGSTHLMVADLMKTGFPHYKVHEQIFDTFLENRLKFFGHVLLNRMDVNYELNTVLIAISKKDLRDFDIRTGDTEGLVNYPLSMQGIKMAAIVTDRDEERRWSFRSKGDVDVNVFARKYFEGGGHKNAAGGRSSESLEKTVEYFQEVILTMTDSLTD